METQLGHPSPTLHHRHSSLGRPSQGLWEPEQKPSLDLVLRLATHVGVWWALVIWLGGLDSSPRARLPHNHHPRHQSCLVPYPTSQGLQDRPAVNPAVSLLPSNHHPPEGGEHEAGVGGY